MLRYQIDKLVHAGVKEVVLAVNYYSELIMKECEAYEQEYGIKIIYSKEDYELGTAGPLALAKEYLRGSAFFVMNSDICCNANLLEMKKKFLDGNKKAMLMTFPVKDPSRYGLVKTEEDLIVSFTEKPKRSEETELQEESSSLINAGVYIFRDAILEDIELKETSLEKDVFPKLARDRQLLHYQLDGYWMDIGQIQDYLSGQKMCLENESLEELKGACKDGQDNSTIRFLPKENVVIGRGVTIGRGVLLENCAVFDGATIGDNSIIKNSIIGWECVVGNNCFIEDVSALGKGVSIQNNINIKAMRINPAQFISANIEEGVDEGCN